MLRTSASDSNWVALLSSKFRIRALISNVGEVDSMYSQTLVVGSVSNGITVDVPASKTTVFLLKFGRNNFDTPSQ